MAFLSLRSQPRPFEETNPDRVEAGQLFDKDMLLTEAQWRDLALRKGLASQNYRWPESGDGFPHVPYRFADANVDQVAVKAGIAHWEQHTCLKFDLTTNENQPHLKFQKLSGCWSYVGYISQFSTGQDISIGQGCTSLGTVAHEIGHAIGFYHEQSRPDRDDSIHINEENIVDGRENNFAKKSDSLVDSQGIPYDYSSDMHYGGFGFSKNGRLTIATVDPRNQELIGRRDGLSHRDTHLANLMYGCIDKWKQACGMDSDPCQNGGYTGANCACVCPQGTSGSSCETLEEDYFASQRSDCSARITSPGTVTSPNYPSNYPYGVVCAKWVVAPECKLPRVTFTAFRLSDCWDKLEIRTSNRYDGDFYCGTSIAPGTSFTSTTNELILMFYTRTNYETGWSADVTFIDDPNCSPASDHQPLHYQPLNHQPLSHQPHNHPTHHQPLSHQLHHNPLQTVLYSLPAKDTDVFLFQDSPYMTTFKINSFKLQKKKLKKCVDFVGIQIPYNRTVKLCGARKGSIFVPNLNLEANFVTDNAVTDVGFNVSITWQKTQCHRVIELSDDSATGVIQSPGFPENYPKNSVCEWWIVAPEGKRVHLEFTKISIKDRKCLGAYIAVDKSGRASYMPEHSSLLCAGMKTSCLVSEGRTVNVAFAGGSRTSKGFSARYTVV
ncbi:Blastula protease-10 [Penaeus vannamei]|uniref:Metalloendopeptidase n=1 Tax=Penaeus vannamei TaxID=6689 RepID=A0A423TTM6_PENVA|nr:Blastula protease-10 [Penaeus vannamei]